MQSVRRRNKSVGVSLSFGLLLALLGVVWLAGGASRADVLGQVIVRGAAWATLIVLILAGARPSLGAVRWPLIFLALVLALPLVQLIPLPPALWLSLPGRDVLANAMTALGQPQPWRPWSMTPNATANAAASLIVPIAALILISGVSAREKAWLPGIFLGLIAASMLVGLLEFTGIGFNSVLINDTPGDVSSIFANRNHFALFLAIGCLLAPVWAFQGNRRPASRAVIAAGLMLLFILTILATGSRAGMALGAIATAIGLILTRRGLRRELRGAPRWVVPAVIGGLLATIAIFVLISVTADRAASVNRLLAIDSATDTRVRALPTVLEMVGRYFPAGTGFGSFDPLFRINEPFSLLKPTYFNHAHNDFLEIVLDGGLPAALLLIAVLAWVAVVGFRAWREGGPVDQTLPQVGAAIVLLVAMASVVDYPARTPIIMIMLVIAAFWLADRERGDRDVTLPKIDPRL